MRGGVGPPCPRDTCEVGSAPVEGKARDLPTFFDTWGPAEHGASLGRWPVGAPFPIDSEAAALLPPCYPPADARRTPHVQPGPSAPYTYGPPDEEQ